MIWIKYSTGQKHIRVDKVENLSVQNTLLCINGVSIKKEYKTHEDACNMLETILNYMKADYNYVIDEKDLDYTDGFICYF